MTTEQQLQLLLDKAAISDVVYSYATGLDRQDWALYRSIFTDEIEMTYPNNNGVPERLKADDWVARWVPAFAGWDATQHVSTNHRFEINGDEATCISYMTARHVINSDGVSDYYLIGGYYTNRLVRTPAGWKLRAVTLTVTWIDGNPEIRKLAHERGRKRLGIS
jgi:hypothetical protein